MPRIQPGLLALRCDAVLKRCTTDAKTFCTVSSRLKRAGKSGNTVSVVFAKEVLVREQVSHDMIGRESDSCPLRKSDLDATAKRPGKTINRRRHILRSMADAGIFTLRLMPSQQLIEEYSIHIEDIAEVKVQTYSAAFQGIYTELNEDAESAYHLVLLPLLFTGMLLPSNIPMRSLRMKRIQKLMKKVEVKTKRGQVTKNISKAGNNSGYHNQAWPDIYTQIRPCSW